MLGLLTLIIVPVQLLLLAFAMRGFSQKWNVEVERHVDDHGRPHDGGHQGEPQPAGA